MALSQELENALMARMGSTAAAVEMSTLLNAISALSGTEANYLDGVTPGTASASKAVVLDSNKDVAGVRKVTCTDTLRFGKTITEGYEINVIDEVVTLTAATNKALATTIPTGVVVLSAQLNLDTAVTAAGNIAKVGLGLAASDPDLYGKTAALTKNAKSDHLPADYAVTGDQTIAVCACQADGSIATSNFTAGEKVRVRIVYAALNSLDDAA